MHAHIILKDKIDTDIHIPHIHTHMLILSLRVPSNENYQTNKSQKIDEVVISLINRATRSIHKHTHILINSCMCSISLFLSSVHVLPIPLLNFHSIDQTCIQRRNQQFWLRRSDKYDDTSKCDKYIHKHTSQKNYNIFTYIVGIYASVEDSTYGQRDWPTCAW